MIFENKGGSTKIKVLLWIIALSILITLIFSHYGCKITAEDHSYTQAKDFIKEGSTDKVEWDKAVLTVDSYGTSSKGILWVKQHILDCSDERVGIISKSVGAVKDFLGLDKSIYNLFPDLLVGGLAGLWLFIIYFIAGFELFHLKFLGGSQARLKATWFAFIADSVWKIIPIAVGYAVLMQLPFVSTAINFITLDFLLYFKGDAFGGFLKSIIIAFYIGLLPAGIEAYTKYKIKRKYQDAVTRARYRGRMIDAMATRN